MARSRERNGRARRRCWGTWARRRSSAGPRPRPPCSGAARPVLLRCARGRCVCVGGGARFEARRGAAVRATLARRRPSMCVCVCVCVCLSATLARRRPGLASHQSRGIIRSPRVFVSVCVCRADGACRRQLAERLSACVLQVRPRAHAHPHPHPLALALALALARTLSYQPHATPTPTPTPTLTRARTRKRAHTHGHLRAHSRTRTRTRTQAHACARMYPRAGKRRHGQSMRLRFVSLSAG